MRVLPMPSPSVTVTVHSSIGSPLTTTVPAAMVMTPEGPALAFPGPDGEIMVVPLGGGMMQDLSCGPPKASLPTETRTVTKAMVDEWMANDPKDGANCMICLSDPMEEGSEVSACVNCKQCFHAECLFKWCKEDESCPKCRHHVLASDAVSEAPSEEAAPSRVLGGPCTLCHATESTGWMSGPMGHLCSACFGSPSDDIRADELRANLWTTALRATSACFGSPPDDIRSDELRAGLRTTAPSEGAEPPPVAGGPCVKCQATESSEWHRDGTMCDDCLIQEIALCE